MYQDKNGYFWFGTYDGLNLFNSKSVFVYRFDLQTEMSLCSNIIHKITPAENDHIWVSTFLGLNKFSLNNRRVTESYPECPEAKLIACDPLGNTCVIINGNIFGYYTPEEKKFHSIQLPEIDIKEIVTIEPKGNNTFFLLMTNGELLNVEIIRINGSYEGVITPESAHKYDIVFGTCDNNTLYWVDKNGWLYAHHLLKNQTVFIQDISQLIGKHGTIAQITSFRNDIYLAFKSNGVLKLVRNKQYHPQDVNMEIGVFSLLPDKYQNILWIGTDGQGIQMYYDKPDQFRNIKLDQLPLNLQKPVRAIYADNNALWIGTKGGGVVCIDDYNSTSVNMLPSGKVKSFTTNDGLSSNQVFSIQKSTFRNLLWIGTEGPGISYYFFDKNKIITPAGSENEKIEKVHSICEINDSTLCIATAGAGLQKVIYHDDDDGEVEIKSVEIVTFEKNGRECNEFHALLSLGDSTLLIGSRGGYGLIKFNILSNDYSFIPLNNSDYSAIGDVLSVHQSKDSVFYIGASSGLTKMQMLPDNQFVLLEQFDRRDGLANDMIHGILEDIDGCLWLSTNKGLTKYNPKNNYFHNYTQGLEITEFSDDAFWQSPSTNRLFFGGVNGLVWLDANKNTKPRFKAALSIFELKFSGEAVDWTSHFNDTQQELVIPSDVESFSISFVAVDNYSFDNYEYSYNLEGKDQDWIKLQKNNEITFNALPHKSYTLHVKFNNDVFSSENYIHSISIRVLPPWYLTTYMVVLYFFVSLLIFFLSTIYIKIQINKKQLAITKKLEEEQRENLLETKLNFFTNITHELCTPLTLINGLSDQIDKHVENDLQLKQYTSRLNRNVSDLNDLIQEILDFRKIEDFEFGMCHMEEVSISKLIAEVTDSFIPLSIQNNTNFKIETSGSLFWNTDSAFLKKILTNLISNAFKYSQNDGFIKVSAKIEGSILKISVYNTGIGIKESELQNIFDRFIILDDSSERTNITAASRNGLGLSICKSLASALKGKIEVKSEADKYAEFTVILPKTNGAIGSFEGHEHEKGKFLKGKQLDLQSPRPQILVVDDNKDITWLISQALSLSYDIKEASDAMEALDMIEKKTPDLIITDIIMPQMSGLDFVSQIKSGLYTKHIPIIIVSAKITNNEQAEGFNIGANAYLTKPFSPHLLTSVVQRLLNNKTELKKYYQSSESAYELSAGKVIHVEDKALLERVVSVIKENLDNEKLRPNFIAKELGINIRSFYRYFKSFSDMSPNDFIKDYRLSYAAHLLLTTKLTVQEIIYKIGFSNKSFFYREFLRKFNTTPKDYRNQEVPSNKDQ
jgi:signal transduction histidine kinase/CheY-like chemotaxis protein/ligand-binding sensor domain-containing protein